MISVSLHCWILERRNRVLNYRYNCVRFSRSSEQAKGKCNRSRIKKTLPGQLFEVSKKRSHERNAIFLRYISFVSLRIPHFVKRKRNEILLGMKRRKTLCLVLLFKKQSDAKNLKIIVKYPLGGDIVIFRFSKFCPGK